MCSQVLFGHAIYHMSRHFCACVGACVCDHMPLLKRPGVAIFTKKNKIKSELFDDKKSL